MKMTKETLFNIIFILLRKYSLSAKLSVAFTFRPSNYRLLKNLALIYVGMWYGVEAITGGENGFLALWQSRNSFFFEFPGVIFVTTSAVSWLLSYRRSRHEHVFFCAARAFASVFVMALALIVLFPDCQPSVCAHPISLLPSQVPMAPVGFNCQ